jgi:PAS domain S-box-containing protein
MIEEGRAELLELCKARAPQIVEAWNEGIRRIRAFTTTPSPETRANVERCFAAFMARLRGEGDGLLLAFTEDLAERRFTTGFEIDGPIAAAARFRDGIQAASPMLSSAGWAAVQAELDAFNSAFSTAFATRLVDRSENRLRELFEDASDVLMRLDTTGSILEVNRSFEQGLGHPRAEWRGRSVVDLLQGSEREEINTLLLAVLRGETIENHPVTLHTADGQPRQFELSAHASETDGVRSAIVMLRDVTHERGLRAQVIQAEKLASIGQLAASTAHELNNPLTWVYGNLEQTLADLSKPPGAADMEQIHEMLSEALIGTKRMAAIVQDLRTYAGGQTDALAEFDLGQVVSLAIRIAGSELQGRATLRSQLNATPRVTGNPGRLSQVLVNLLVNAGQAHDAEPGAERIVQIETRSDGAHVEIEVADNGRGIPANMRGRIFEPFVTTKGSEGTGLGLWVARNIVEQHGGSLRLHGDDDWTRFIVRIPVRSGDASRGADEPSVTAAERALTVLVVDDEAAILRILERRFERHRMRAITANSGRAALEILDRSAPEIHAIVCDLGMPEMDGLQLHETVARRWPALARRLFFLSGAPRWERGRTPRPCFDKPLGVEDLIRTLLKDELPDHAEG